MGGEHISRLRSNLESKIKSITVRLLLKLSVVASAVLLFSGSLVFTVNNALSQELGYASFIALVISSALLLLGIAFKTKKNVNEKFAVATNFKDSSFSSFFLVNALASSLLIFISLRLVIFGNSLTGISNPNPAFNNLWAYPFNLISGYTGNGQGFIVQSFYPNLLSLIPMPLLLYQKILIIFEFYFYYFLAAAVSTVLYRAIGIKSINKSLFSVMFSYLFLANLIFRSEGFSSFIIGPIMIAYVLSKIYESVKYDRFSTDEAILVGFAVSFAVFGDPRTLVYFFIITLGTVLSAPLFRKTLAVAKFLAKSYAVVLPLFGIMYFMTSFVAVFQPNAGRAGDLPTIEFFSSSTAPMFIFNFMANWWSNFVVAPPTVILTGLKSLNFMPTIYAGNAIAIVPGGPLTIFWSVSLSVVSIFAILSLYLIFRSEDDRSLGIIILPFILLFILTLGTNIGFMPVVRLSAYISTLPIVGSIWAVTVSTPQFIDQYLSSFLIVLALFSVLTLTQFIETNLPKSKKSLKLFHKNQKLRRALKYVPLALILFMFLFANWQFIDQSYAIGQQLPGELPGNSVGNVSYLTPVTPPPGWLETYQKMYPTENLSYSVYSNDGYSNLLKWDHGFNIGDSPGISPNPEFATLFNKILNYNESWLLPTLMQEFGVKYIFFDKTQVNPDWSMLTFLNYSGLPSYQNASTDLFYTDNSSEISTSQYLFSAGGFSNQDILNLTYLLHSAGYNAALSPSNRSGISFTKNLGNASGTYISLGNISSMYPSRILPEMTGKYSGSSNADIFWIGNDWYVTSYNGGYYVNYSFNNGSLSVNRYSPSPENYNESSPPLFFLSYTNSSSNLTGGSVIDVPSGYSVVVNFAFGYRSTSSGYAGFFAGPNYDAMKESNSSRSINGTFTIPAGTKDFGIGFSFSSYNGTFTVIHPHISYTFVKNSMVDLHSTDMGNASGTQHNATYMDVTGVPDTEYVVSYSGSYDGENHHTFHFTAESNSSGVLNISLSDVNFLGELAIFKADYPSTPYSDKGISKIQFLNGGSDILMNGISAHYIVISYSPDYSWKSSSGLKFVGVNAFGQQVFEVPSNGNYSIYILGADLHIYSDWATALFMNVGFPTLLLIGMYRRRKASKNDHRS